jgi:hypothetical protein
MPPRVAIFGFRMTGNHRRNFTSAALLVVVELVRKKD